MLLSCIYVGIGGFCGAVLRFLCNEAGRALAVPSPALVTLLINVVGSFAIMFFGAALGRTIGADSNLMLLLRVGLCGGFTTFSTFSAEALGLIHTGQPWQALLYAAGSCVLCLLAAFAGEIAGDCVAPTKGM